MVAPCRHAGRQPLIGYNIAIKACEKQKDVAGAQGLLKQMELQQLLPDIISYTSAMRVCGACAQWATAVLLLSELRQKSVQLDLLAMNVAIQAVMQWRVALALFWEILEIELLPDLVTFSTVLGTMECQWQLACQLYGFIEKSHLSADTICHQVMVSAMGCASWQRALRLSSRAVCFCLTTNTRKDTPPAFLAQGSAWVQFNNPAVVVSMLLLVAVHLRLTKSDVYLGLAALRQQLRHRKVPTQRELEKEHRFEAELLRVRIEVCDGVRRVGIHIVFAYSISIMQQLLLDPSPSSCMQLLGTLGEYALHVLLQAGFIKIKTSTHFRILQCVSTCGYAVYVHGVANEMDHERFCATEKLLAAAIMVQSVVFLDCKVTVPVYIFGAAVVTLKQWHWMGFLLSRVVWHVTFAGMMTCVVYAIQYHIAARLESDDTSSLLLASRCVLGGVCDGDVVLDCRSHRIVEDSTSLERLLNVKKTLSGSNFLDLFLDADGRQRFLQFLQSEALPQERKAAIPPCLRIVLQGAHGPVSTDVFCTSCAAAGQDFYLLALRADPDQCGIPPDAPGPPQSAAWQFDQEQRQQQRQPSEGSSVEVAEAFKELMQVRLLVNIDTPRLDIEEATMSFSRSRHRDGMPTLRSFVSISDWDRVEDLFRSAKDSFKAGGGKVWRFPSTLLLRIPGSRPRTYLRARSAVVTIGDEDEDEESESPPAFEDFAAGHRVSDRAALRSLLGCLEESPSAWRSTVQVLATLPQLGIAAGKMHETCGMTALQRASLWKDILDNFLMMPSRTLAPNAACYNIAIDASPWPSALELLEKAQWLQNLRGLSRAARLLPGWRSSMALLGALGHSFLEPDVVVMTSICQAHGMPWLSAMRLLGFLALAGVEQDALLHQAATGRHGFGSSETELVYSRVSQCCDAASHWQQACEILCRCDSRTSNSILQQGRLGRRWGLAILSLRGVQPLGNSWWVKTWQWTPSAKWLPDSISFNVAMDQCEKRGRWRVVVDLWEQMPQRSLQRSVVSLGSAVSTLERAQHWQGAFWHHCCMREAQTSMTSMTTYGSLMSACARQSFWKLAFLTLQEMYLEDVPSEISLDAAVRACASCSQRAHGLTLLWDAEESGALSKTSGTFYLLALARLNLRDPDILRAALLDVVRHIPTTPQDLCSSVWSLASLGVRSPQLLKGIVQQLGNLQSFTWEALGVLCWSWVSLAVDVQSLDDGTHSADDHWQFLNLLQLEAVQRFNRAEYEVRWGTLGQHLLSMIWACSLGQALSSRFLCATRNLLRAHGRSLDESGAKLPRESKRSKGRDEWQEPLTIPCELPDRLVLFKPPGWEVHDGYLPLQLRDALQKWLGEAAGPTSITQDSSHSYGFLHRLDVPSSGLVLAAKTYEAFYDLQIQLAAGHIGRHYVVLAHGWMPRTTKKIHAFLWWQGGSPTVAGATGKPSATELRCMFRSSACRGSGSFSLLRLRIFTGRRHQIRSHLAFIGHPVIHDAIYSSYHTVGEDQLLCTRNFLHRYSLSFDTASGEPTTVRMPCPADLLTSLKQVFYGCEATALRDFLRDGLPTEPWDDP
eukprot:s1211_g8.t3